MEDIKKQPLSRWLQYHARQFGWQGLSGITMLLGSATLALTIVLPKTDKLDQLSREVEKLRIEIPQHQGKWIDRSPQASLNTFYHFLPAEHQTTNLLATILVAANDNELTVDKADYALTRNSQAAFSRYQITMPISGSYVNIRKFTNQVLNTLPAAALNEITFKRQDISAETIEARLRFTIYLGKEQQQ